MARGQRQIEHILRRVAFGAPASDVAAYADMTIPEIVESFIDYDQVPDDVDTKIGQAAYVGVTARGEFQPSQNIIDARQRWLFRMVHSARPLQEKMALFWHNHFATGYNKVAQAGAIQATRYLAAKPSEDPGQVKGQLELMREYAVGNFRDFLIAMSKDTAMLFWLDGRTNTKARPQENYGREIMELFTMGVGFYTEPDVYAAAKVFSGWNLKRIGATSGTDQNAYAFAFNYDANQHDASAKTFSFPIYADGSKTIPARSSTDGMQDGLDLIGALCAHPETGRRLARKLWNYFVSEMSAPDPAWVDGVARIFTSGNYEMRPVLRYVLGSSPFLDPANHFSRYSWPVEYVVRAIKEAGWNGFSVNSALAPLTNMGQTLFEPPDVAGWDLGAAWISTNTMLARMNFAATLAANQRFNLAAAAKPHARSAEGLVAYLDGRYPAMAFSAESYRDLLTYASAGGWTGTDAQIQAKAAGLSRLIVGSGEYVFV